MKIPKGYEVAPPEHVMRRGVDILGYVCKRPIGGKMPPKGWAWVSGYDGMRACYTSFTVCRPIEKAVKPVRCRHENTFEGNEQSTGFPYSWCRDCGAFWHPGRRKWVYPKGVKR